MAHTSSKSNGFTLLELTVVLVIIGLLVAALATFLTQYVREIREQEYREKIDTITSSLANYIKDESFRGDDPATPIVEGPLNFVTDPDGAINFPCPADPNLGPGDAGFGQEVRVNDGANTTVNPWTGAVIPQTTCSTAGGITGVDTNADGTDDVFYGAIPVATIDLDSDYIVDQYGQKFTYAVSRGPSLNFGLSGASPVGNITIDIAPPGPASDIPGIDFAIIHHGQDASGSNSLQGAISVPCPGAGATLDQQNCDDADGVIIAEGDNRNLNRGSGLYYDDRVVFTLRGIADKEEYWQFNDVNPLAINHVNPSHVLIDPDSTGASFLGVGTEAPISNLTVANAGHISLVEAALPIGTTSPALPPPAAGAQSVSIHFESVNVPGPALSPLNRLFLGVDGATAAGNTNNITIDTTNAHVGIGVINPLERLHVAEGTDLRAMRVDGGIQVFTDINDIPDLDMAAQGLITSGGNLFIGIDSDNSAGGTDTVRFINNSPVVPGGAAAIEAATFIVMREDGRMAINAGSVLNNRELFIDGELEADAFFYTSDMNMKKDITDLDDDTLEKIMMTRIIKYNLIDDSNEQKKIGVIAQSLQQLFPGLVNDRGDGRLSVDYISLIGPVIKAVQELRSEKNEEIEALETEIETLKGTIEDMNERLKALETRLAE